MRRREFITLLSGAAALWSEAREASASETPPVHHPSRQRGGRLAAGGEGAAARARAPHRFPHALRRERSASANPQCGFPAGTAAIGMNCRAERPARLSLVGGQYGRYAQIRGSNWRRLRQTSSLPLAVRLSRSMQSRAIAALNIKAGLLAGSGSSFCINILRWSVNLEGSSSLRAQHSSTIT